MLIPRQNEMVGDYTHGSLRSGQKHKCYMQYLNLTWVLVRMCRLREPFITVPTFSPQVSAQLLYKAGEGLATLKHTFIHLWTVGTPWRRGEIPKPQLT